MTSEFLSHLTSQIENFAPYRENTQHHFYHFRYFLHLYNIKHKFEIVNLKDYEKSKNRKPLGRSTHRARRYGSEYHSQVWHQP